ncbi:hypothetical protein DFH08DRAFT_813357 [Mycena albidolilacea]|uniref:Uncharacterized protein n=1 Tax=Mycena albidolilacea TaxID=1033008 RepID=A0AAD7ELG7_9AGAR|nr:hypothetical protein DFH08DRAFT_813357 [Mycena albidolilacea]
MSGGAQLTSKHDTLHDTFKVTKSLFHHPIVYLLLKLVRVHSRLGDVQAGFPSASVHFPPTPTELTFDSRGTRSTSNYNPVPFNGLTFFLHPSSTRASSFTLLSQRWQFDLHVFLLRRRCVPPSRSTYMHQLIPREYIPPTSTLSTKFVIQLSATPTRCTKAIFPQISQARAEPTCVDPFLFSLRASRPFQPPPFLCYIASFISIQRSLSIPVLVLNAESFYLGRGTQHVPAMWLGAHLSMTF